MRRVVIDMQNYLLADAISKLLRDYDSDFLTEMSERPEKTAELCRLVQANILIMETGRYSPWSIEETVAMESEAARRRLTSWHTIADTA